MFLAWYVPLSIPYVNTLYVLLRWSFTLFKYSLSVFNINVPFSFNPSTISNFAFKTLASVFNVDKCWGPICVIIAILGLTNLLNLLISPILKVPISTINNSIGLFKSLLIVRLIPIRVLYDLGVLRVKYFLEIIWYSISFVEVLPKLPVIPILTKSSNDCSFCLASL